MPIDNSMEDLRSVQMHKLGGGAGGVPLLKVAEEVLGFMPYS